MDMPKHLKEYWEMELAKQYATINLFEKPKQEDIDFWLELIRSEHWDEICEHADREKYLDYAGVVRCGECVHKQLVNEVWECEFGLMIKGEDGFCNYGERNANIT